MFLKKISLCVMTLLFASVAANAQGNTSSNIGSLVEVHKFDDITTNIYRYPFASLDWTDPSGGLALSGTQAKRNVRFEIRNMRKRKKQKNNKRNKEKQHGQLSKKASTIRVLLRTLQPTVHLLTSAALTVWFTIPNFPGSISSILLR